MKKVYNIGIYEKGIYDTVKDKKAYTVWKNILQRCYDEKTLNRFPSYKGCAICSDWIYFQTFAKWFYQTYIEGYTIDKDILGNGKLYSPDNCCFVPNHINNLLHENLHIKSGMKSGVTMQDGRYRVRVNTIDKKKKHIGYFDTEIDAYEAYKIAKYKAICDAVKYYNINEKISNAIKAKYNENI